MPAEKNITSKGMHSVLRMVVSIFGAQSSRAAEFDDVGRLVVVAQIVFDRFVAYGLAVTGHPAFLLPASDFGKLLIPATN